MVKIAVLVSGGGTNLEALLRSEENKTLTGGHIEVVISDREGAYALERARKHKKEALLLNKKEVGTKRFEELLITTLKKREISLIVLAGFLSILSPTFINEYRDRIINIHPSLIPSFCGKGYYGLRVHEEALKRGVKLTGATVHLVNEVPDGGRILLQKAVKVEDDDTPATLQKRVMEEAEWKLLPLATELMCKEIGGEDDNR